MAKSKLAVINGGAVQTVTEPDADIENLAAPDNLIVLNGGAAPPLNLTTEEAAKEPATEIDGQSTLENPAVPESIEAPPSELTTEETAILAHEGEAALREMGEEQLEPPAPFDFGGEHVTDTDEIATPLDESNAVLPEKQESAPEAEQPPAPEQKQGRRGRPPKADRADKEPTPEKQARRGKEAPQKTQETGAEEDTRQEWEKPLSELEPKKERKPPAAKEKPADEEKAQATEGPTLKERKQKLEQELREKYGIPKTDKPVAPWIAPEVEQVVRIPHDKLHSFKDHPFNVEKDAKFMAFVASIRAHGVTQPAIIRPDGKDGYEIISGHRRDLGSIEAEIPYTPCIIRALNDDQAIQQMVEDNVNNREIGTMELAKALKMQLEAIKHQGARQALEGKDFTSDVDKRSNEIIAERNGMSVKQVQRHIALTRLTPALQTMVDGKTVGDNKALKLSFTPAVELSYIKPRNQDYIAVAIEGQQSAPSLSQAQRMRELDQKSMLNADIIDGIMLEEKKEVDKVIISSQELSQYFGKDQTPRDMKDQILKLLDEWKGKQPELSKPKKKQEQEK